MLYKWRQGKIQNSNPTSRCSQDGDYFFFYLKSSLGEIKIKIHQICIRDKEILKVNKYKIKPFFNTVNKEVL